MDSAVRRTPPDTHLSGLQSDFNFQRVQSSGLRWTHWTPLLWTIHNFKNFIFQWTPVDSGGLNMWQYVTRLESGQVRRSPAEHVGECKVLASSILRFWLHFPDEEDYLVRPTLLDIVTTNFPPSILFLDKIWEMYRTPFSTIFNNNWDVWRSNTKLSKGLADFKKEFGIYPFTITSSSSHDKLETLSELIYKWMQFSGVDSNTAEIVSNNQSILI